MILDGIEVHNGLSPEESDRRRVLMMDLLAMLRRGESVPKPALPELHRILGPAVPKPKTKRECRAAYRRPPRTPEELLAAREKRRTAERNRRLRVREEEEAGLRPVKLRPPAPPRVPKAAFSIPEGAWITFRARKGGFKTVRVVAHVPINVPPPIPEGSTFLHGRKAEASRVPRYLVAIPALDDMAHPAVITVHASELERALVKIHEEPPTIGRFHQPIPVGTAVTWMSHGAHTTVSRAGIVMGYIPAGVSMTGLGLAEPGRIRAGIQETSIRDRYAVAVTRERNSREIPGVVYPAAYVLEQANGASTPLERGA